MAKEDIINWNISINSFEDKELIRYVEREMKRTRRSRARIVRDLIKDAMYFRAKEQVR